MAAGSHIADAHHDAVINTFTLHRSAESPIHAPFLPVPGGAFVEQHLAVVHVEQRIALVVLVATWKPYVHMLG